jgi:iron complex outermembrane recepter protein
MRMKTPGVASVLALATGLAAPAYAQEEDSGNRNTEIVVTAEFREANLQDTPIAITAVNAEMLEARGQTDISQVAAQAPNVSLRPQGQNSGIGLIAFIRGVGQTDFNYALEPGVGIYVDDVYIPTLSSSLLDLMDLERVEVLRGPQGTLAGKNSIGGAIKLFSQRPDGSGEGSLQATYGSYNRVELRGFGDFRLTDNLFARVSGVSKSRDGYVTMLDYGTTHPNSNVQANNNAGKQGVFGTLGGQSMNAGKLALRWVPTDQLEVNISADYTRERSDSGAEVLLWANSPGTTPDGIAFLVGKNGAAVPADCRFVPYNHVGVAARPNASCDTPPAGYDPRFISYANFLDARVPTTQAPFKPFAAKPGNEYDGWGIHGNITYEISDALQLVWISSWREYRMSFGEDQDASPVPISTLNQTLDHRAWSQELRLNGELGDGLAEYTLGGFYFDQNGSLNARVDLNYAGIDFIHGPDTTPSTSKALFFNGTLHPADGLSLSGGLRYSTDKKVYTYFRSNPDGTIPAAPCEFFTGTAPPGTVGPTGVGNSPNCLLVGLYNISDAFEGNRWDWRVVADYRFSDQFLAYASASTGYKGGGVNPRPFFGPASPNNQLKAFNPETITTYELGFKADLFDRRLRLNGAGFFNKYSDIILTLSACPISPCLQPNNVGSADVKGLELEMTAFPVDGLSIDASFAYLDFGYTTTGTSGVPLTAVTPYTPEVSWSAGAQYDHEIEAGTISFRLDGTYQGEVFTEATNTPESRIPGRFLSNARLSFSDEDNGWRLSLEVQNLLDKYYFHTVSDITKSLLVQTGQPALPRTWSVTLKKNF